MSFVKKQNISIVVDEREGKKYYKTIGELVTMHGNDGEYQFIKLWGAGGVVNAKVFDQTDSNNQNNTPQQGYGNQGNARTQYTNVPQQPVQNGAAPYQQNAPVQNAAGSSSRHPANQPMGASGPGMDSFDDGSPPF